MKTNLAQLFCGLALLGAVATVSAQTTITYTETGFLTGSLGGIGFSNAAVTMTAVGDPANINYVTYPNLPPGLSAYSIACANVTVQIAGFSLATFTVDTYGVNAWNNYGTSGATYIMDLSMNWAYVWGNGNTSPTYDLSTATTFTDYEAFSSVPFSTDQGDLLITAAAGNGLATFNAVVGPVPEPSTLALSALGGLLLFRRRK